MRSLTLSTLAVTLTLAACSSDTSKLRCTTPTDTTAALGESFNTRYGETTTIQDEGLSLRFAEIYDSRCPVDVTCGWEGDADVRIEAQKPPAEAAILQLHSNKSFLTGSTAEYQGYQVELLL